MHLVNTSLRAILLHQSDWFLTHRICIIRKSLLCQSGLLRCDVHVCGLEYEELGCLCLVHGSGRKHYDLLEGSVLEFSVIYDPGKVLTCCNSNCTHLVSVARTLH